MGRVIVCATAGTLGLILFIAVAAGGVVAAIFGTSGQGLNCTATLVTPPTESRPKDLNAEQARNAATIIGVGRELRIPVRGWVIAIATALQESDLINLGNLGAANDHDSLGLFQQRPSQGWGTPEQIMNPRYAAGAFYTALRKVPGWESMPLTVAAQAVQRSAFGDAYAAWEAKASTIVGVVGFGDSQTIPGDLGQCPVNCPGLLSSGRPSGPDVGCLAGTAVLARAEAWLTAWDGGPVPYLSSADPTTWFNGYRRDCSGYAWMALGLPGPGLDTAGLAARSTPIQKTDLRAGDLLINAALAQAGHVVIFDHWTDATMTSYVGYEQSGDGGTHHRVIPYPYFDGDPHMSPYRF